MNPKFCIYIKDVEILKLVNQQKNKSEYVERAIRFYEDNKDALVRIANALEKNTRNH